jgi:ribosomal protein S6
MGGYKELAYLLKELEKGISVAIDCHVEQTTVLSEVNKRFSDLYEYLYKGGE